MDIAHPSRVFKIGFVHLGKRGWRGFSLVEVVLALGIVAVSVVAVLGLMPIGMGAFQEANRSNIEAEIVAQLAREIESASFAQLQADFATPQTYYYDFEGRQLFAPGGGEPTDWAYRAEVELQQTMVQGVPIRATGRANPNRQTIFQTALINMVTFRERNQPGKVRRFPVHVVDRGIP